MLSNIFQYISKSRAEKKSAQKKLLNIINTLFLDTTFVNIPNNAYHFIQNDFKTILADKNTYTWNDLLTDLRQVYMPTLYRKTDNNYDLTILDKIIQSFDSIIPAHNKHEKKLLNSSRSISVKTEYGYSNLQPFDVLFILKKEQDRIRARRIVEGFCRGEKKPQTLNLHH